MGPLPVAEKLSPMAERRAVHAAAHEPDRASPPLGRLGLDRRLTVGFESRKGSLVVGSHGAAVADGIGGEHGNAAAPHRQSSLGEETNRPPTENPCPAKSPGFRLMAVSRHWASDTARSTLCSETDAGGIKFGSRLLKVR